MSRDRKRAVFRAGCVTMYAIEAGAGVWYVGDALFGHPQHPVAVALVAALLTCALVALVVSVTRLRPRRGG